jgi:Sec7-like guanine-nucleotide exchange factor
MKFLISRGTKGSHLAKAKPVDGVYAETSHEALEKAWDRNPVRPNEFLVATKPTSKAELRLFKNILKQRTWQIAGTLNLLHRCGCTIEELEKYS